MSKKKIHFSACDFSVDSGAKAKKSQLKSETKLEKERKRNERERQPIETAFKSILVNSNTIKTNTLAIVIVNGMKIENEKKEREASRGWGAVKEIVCIYTRLNESIYSFLWLIHHTKLTLNDNKVFFCLVFVSSWRRFCAICFITIIMHFMHRIL